MTYAINSPHKEKMIHPKSIADSSVTYIILDYATEGISLTLHNINGEVV